MESYYRTTVCPDLRGISLSYILNNEFFPVRRISTNNSLSVWKNKKVIFIFYPKFILSLIANLDDGVIGCVHHCSKRVRSNWTDGRTRVLYVCCKRRKKMDIYTISQASRQFQRRHFEFFEKKDHIKKKDLLSGWLWKKEFCKKQMHLNIMEKNKYWIPNKNIEKVVFHQYNKIFPSLQQRSCFERFLITHFHSQILQNWPSWGVLLIREGRLISEQNQEKKTKDLLVDSLGSNSLNLKKSALPPYSPDAKM